MQSLLYYNKELNDKQDLGYNHLPSFQSLYFAMKWHYSVQLLNILQENNELVMLWKEGQGLLR